MAPLPLPHFVRLPPVQGSRHEFQVPDPVGELRSHGHRHDVIHLDQLAGVGATGDRWGSAPSEQSQIVLGEAPQSSEDLQVSPQAILGHSPPWSVRDSNSENLLRVSGDVEPVASLPEPLVGRTIVFEGVQLGAAGGDVPPGAGEVS